MGCFQKAGPGRRPLHASFLAQSLLWHATYMSSLLQRGLTQLLRLLLCQVSVPVGVRFSSRRHTRASGIKKHLQAARPVWPFDWLVSRSAEQAFRAEHGTGTPPHHHGSPIFRSLCGKFCVIAIHHQQYFLSLVSPYEVVLAREGHI